MSTGRRALLAHVATSTAAPLSLLPLGIPLAPSPEAASAGGIATLLVSAILTPTHAILSNRIYQILNPTISVLASSLTWLLSLTQTSCHPPSSWPGLALTLYSATALGTALNAIARQLSRRTSLYISLALVLSLWVLAISLTPLYTSPSVTVFGPGFGLLKGSIYDGDHVSRSTLLLHHLCMLMAAVGIGCLACRASYRRRITGGVLLGAVLLMQLNGEALGWRTSAERIRVTRGQVASAGRCDAYVPSEVDADVARMLARQCERDIQHAERKLEMHYEGRLEAFFFRSAEEKGRLMGASRTYIAKPWRREVYLQLDELPHPVLRHEVAHAVAGELTDGPFKVAAKWGGLWPNPGLIEGLATYVAGEHSGDHDSDAWSRALLELDRLPTARDLFGFDFFGGNVRAAYTAAASMLHYVDSTYGTAALKQAYATGSLEDALPVTLEQANDGWRKWLRAQPLSPAALAQARARFAAKAPIKDACRYTVNALTEDLHADTASLLSHPASSRFRRTDSATLKEDAKALQELSPRRLTVYLALLSAALESQDAQAMTEAIEAPAQNWQADDPALASVYLRLGDLTWRQNNTDLAAQLYDRATKVPQAPNLTRWHLALRELALQPRAGALQQAIAELFIKREQTGARRTAAIQRALTNLRTERPDGLPSLLQSVLEDRLGLPEQACLTQRQAFEQGIDPSWLPPKDACEAWAQLRPLDR